MTPANPTMQCCLGETEPHQFCRLCTYTDNLTFSRAGMGTGIHLKFLQVTFFWFVVGHDTT